MICEVRVTASSDGVAAPMPNAIIIEMRVVELMAKIVSIQQAIKEPLEGAGLEEDPISCLSRQAGVPQKSQITPYTTSVS